MLICLEKLIKIITFEKGLYKKSNTMYIQFEYLNRYTFMCVTMWLNIIFILNSKLFNRMTTHVKYISIYILKIVMYSFIDIKINNNPTIRPFYQHIRVWWNYPFSKNFLWTCICDSCHIPYFRLQSQAFRQIFTKKLKREKVIILFVFIFCVYIKNQDTMDVIMKAFQFYFIFL